MIRKAQRNDRVKITLHDLRDFTEDRHRTIDDYPYGGSAGMVLKIEPIVRCLDFIFKNGENDINEAEFILPSPRGQVFDQSEAKRLSLKSHLVFLCGHYKGIDNRIYDFYPFKEISIGDYILSAGEIAALSIVDSVVRLIPGVLKDIDSAFTDSFEDGLLDAPYYTRPENFRGKTVPEVLLSGNHSKIKEWRQQQRENITKKRRPDLYEKYIN
jgi:tRNA (guanine37-N1)-methyltransferase